MEDRNLVKEVNKFQTTNNSRVSVSRPGYIEKLDFGTWNTNNAQQLEVMKGKGF